MSEHEQILYGFIDIVTQQGASDLHFSAGRVPTLRIDGRLVPVIKSKVFAPEDVRAIVDIILTEEQNKYLERNKSVDTSFSYQDSARFRVNVYYQFGNLAIAMRYIPQEIFSFEQLNLPRSIGAFCEYRQGLVLIAGPAGHGKSTTLAAMIEKINQERQEHIITIEDPIEYIFTPSLSMIDQREVGRDTISFLNALREAFRQDPDIIMVGEIRDSETISTAITAAETGHLVFATLHTNNAAQTINRIIDMFPSEQQQQVRFQLAFTLAGIVSQRLLARTRGGRLPAVEVLFANNAIKNLIRMNKIHEINMVLETSLDDGMITMGRSLAALVRAGEISMEVAQSYLTSEQEFNELLKTKV